MKYNPNDFSCSCGARYGFNDPDCNCPEPPPYCPRCKEIMDESQDTCPDCQSIFIEHSKVVKAIRMEYANAVATIRFATPYMYDRGVITLKSGDRVGFRLMSSTSIRFRPTLRNIRS